MAAWVALRAAFRQTGPLAHFTEFKNAISQKIFMVNPTLDIMVMNKNFQCLMAASVPIPEIVQAMILLNAMPKEYDRIAQTTLQTQEQSKLTFNYVWDAILMEAAKHKLGQPVKQTVSKLSAVKQKGANPKWQPKQQQSDKKDEEESEKKPCAHRHHSGHEVKKHQAKQANNYKEDEEAESSQLASSTFMAAPLAFTTITGCRAVIPPVQCKHLNQLLTKRLEAQPLAQCITMEKFIQDPCKHTAPQDFSSTSIGGPSVYEEYQQAQDTLANINLPKLAHNYFKAMPRIQHGATIKRWWIDQGGGVYQLQSYEYP